MKRMILMLSTAFLLTYISTAASAATTPANTRDVQGAYEIDGSLGFGSGPGDFDAGVGLSFGAGARLDAIDQNLQGRIDISYFNFGTDVFGMNFDFVRVPVTVSARYYLPLNDQLKAFGQVGLETSFDSKDSLVGFRGFFSKETKNEVNVGVTPAAGIEFLVNPEVSIFALGQVHMISDSYFSMHFGAAVHF